MPDFVKLKIRQSSSSNKFQPNCLNSKKLHFCRYCLFEESQNDYVYIVILAKDDRPVYVGRSEEKLGMKREISHLHKALNWKKGKKNRRYLKTPELCLKKKGVRIVKIENLTFGEAQEIEALVIRAFWADLNQRREKLHGEYGSPEKCRDAIEHYKNLVLAKLRKEPTVIKVVDL